MKTIKQTNNSKDFPGTNMIFLDIRKETLPGDSIKCERCGVEHLQVYYKFGMITETQRSKKLCSDCRNDLVA